MNPSSVTKTFLLACILVLAPAASHAAPISGALTTFGSVTFAATTIDFLPPAGGGTGTFTVGLVAQQSGSFVPLAGTAGTIRDLDFLFAPVGVPIFLTDFMLFAADPNIAFRLSLIPFGIFSNAQCGVAAAAGQTCTLPGSAFNFTNTTATSSEMWFSVYGTALNVATGELSAFLGTFLTQFTGASYQQLIAVINGGGFVTSSYVGTFQVEPQRAVPEPSVLLLVCAGIIAVGLMRRGIRIRPSA